MNKIRLHLLKKLSYINKRKKGYLTVNVSNYLRKKMLKDKCKVKWNRKSLIFIFFTVILAFLIFKELNFADIYKFIHQREKKVLRGEKAHLGEDMT